MLIAIIATKIHNVFILDFRWVRHTVFHSVRPRYVAGNCQIIYFKNQYSINVYEDIFYPAIYLVHSFNLNQFELLIALINATENKKTLMSRCLFVNISKKYKVTGGFTSS